MSTILRVFVFGNAAAGALASLAASGLSCADDSNDAWTGGPARRERPLGSLTISIAQGYVRDDARASPLVAPGARTRKEPMGLYREKL